MNVLNVDPDAERKAEEKRRLKEQRAQARKQRESASNTEAEVPPVN
jgi:hypothetical protein